VNWLPYAHYNDTNVEWLERLPASWTISRMGYETWVRARLGWKGLKSDEYVDDGFAFLSTPNIRPENIDFVNVNRITSERFLESPEIILAVGDVLLAKDGSTLGSVNLVKALPEPATVNGSIAVITPGDRLESRYLRYLVSSGFIQNRIQLLKGGMGVPHLFQDDIRTFSVPIPPLPEQNSISNFLDVETAKIDSLIAKQEQLIATLREDRTATITRSVTTGLDSSVDLVRPHDAALPACPKHWTQQISLKRIASVQTGLTLGKTVEPEDAVCVPYMRVANVQTGGLNLDEVKTVEIHRAELNRYLLRPGDVLMTEGGDIDKLGRGCVWTGEIAPCVHQNHVFAVRCKNEIASAFLVYLLETSVARNYFFMTAKKTTNLASTNSTTLGAFTFSLPPRTEQDAIVKFLDGRCSRLDALIAKSYEVIAVLREYRLALITYTVTGKIDVRGAA
jgi:type I restriction enzyme S subunit